MLTFSKKHKHEKNLWSGFLIRNKEYHCVKIVHIRSIFWSLFSCIRIEYGDLWGKFAYSVRIQETTDQKTSYLDTFYAVYAKLASFNPLMHDVS